MVIQENEEFLWQAGPGFTLYFFVKKRTNYKSYHYNVTFLTLASVSILINIFFFGWRISHEEGLQKMVLLFVYPHQSSVCVHSFVSYERLVLIAKLFSCKEKSFAKAFATLATVPDAMHFFSIQITGAIWAFFPICSLRERGN